MHSQIQRAVEEYSSLTVEQLRAERHRLQRLPLKTPDDQARLIAIERIIST